MACLSGEVLQDGGRVDGGSGADATVRRGPALQVTVDTADGELESNPGRQSLNFWLDLTEIVGSMVGKFTSKGI